MRLPYAVTSFVISPRGEITSLRKWQDPEPEKSEQIFNAFSTTLKSVEELISTYEQTIGRGGQLMLGLAPDRRGLLSDADVKRLEEFGAAIRQRYAANLIAREHVPNAATDAAFDGDPDKFWSAPTGSHHAILETSFARPITFDHALTMEWLNDGQHIERYRIEVWTEGKWKTIVESHAIGHQRIDSFQAIKTSRIRLNILSSSAEAHVREFQVFNTVGATVSRMRVDQSKRFRTTRLYARRANERLRVFFPVDRVVLVNVFSTVLLCALPWSAFAMDIREIARRAKVSTATVSRAINRVPTVDPQLARRVWRVVDQLGYYPNTQARALVSGKSRLFGLVVSEITNPFFPEIVQTFEELAVQNDYEILLTSTVHDAKRMKSSVRRMIERRVDGVAILTFGMEESLLDDLRVRKVPLVFVDVGPDAPRVSNIRIDYQGGIRQAVQHLAALRHTAIAFVAGPLHLKSALARKDAFKTSMSEIGLEVAPELLVVGDHTMEGGMRALGELMRFRRRPTAVLCSNDVTAIGVMREAYDLGISVPRDLSVVGFDNIRLSEFMIPPLSTIQMSQAELARIAFRALMDDVAQAGPAEGGREYRLSTSLILRRSTALAPAEPVQGKLSRNRATSASAKS